MNLISKSSHFLLEHRQSLKGLEKEIFNKHTHIDKSVDNFIHHHSLASLYLLVSRGSSPRVSNILLILGVWRQTLVQKRTEEALCTIYNLHEGPWLTIRTRVFWILLLLFYNTVLGFLSQNLKFR